MSQSEDENGKKPDAPQPDPHSAFYRLHEPLGALQMEFTVLEAVVTDAINLLMRLDYPVGAALEASMQNFSTRIHLFHTLASLNTTNSELLKEAKNIVTNLHNANTARNNMLHDEWTSASWSGDVFGKVRYKVEGGRLKRIPNLENVSPTEIWNAVDLAYWTGQRLRRWQECFRIPNPARWPQPLQSQITHSPRRKAAAVDNNERPKKEQPHLVEDQQKLKISVSRNAVYLSRDKKELTIAFGERDDTTVVASTEALNDFIKILLLWREQMEPAPPGDYTPVVHVQAIRDPKWFTEPEMSMGGSLLHIRHPSLGWVSFWISPHSLLELVGYLQNQLNPQKQPES